MLMKLTIPSIGVLATVIVLASIGGIYAISYNSGFVFENDGSPTGAAMMVGNVKVTQFNEHGEVIGIRHGSNHITAQGMYVIMGQVFQGVNGTYADNQADENNVTGRVKYMQIGSAGEQALYANRLAWNNTDIVEPMGDIGGTNPCQRVRIEPLLANVTTQDHLPGIYNAPHGADTQCNNPAFGGNKFACAARMNVTAVAQFDGADCGGSGRTIDEAGIFTNLDTDTGGQMFARNTFGSVDLGSMDTLQLEWEFTFKDDIS